MCHRDSRGGGRSERGGHAGNHVPRDAGGGQELRLFPAASKQKWIAALQPDHSLAVARTLDQQCVDLVLLPGNAPATLADEDAVAEVRRELQDIGIDQRVVDNGVAGFEQFFGTQRQQAGIARTRADQKDFALQARAHATTSAPKRSRRS